MLLKLHVSTRQKLVIGALFSLGSATCVVSAVRIYYTQRLFDHKDDLSWHVVTPTSLVFVECNLSIICGCMMVLRPFLRRHLPFLLGAGADYRRYNNDNDKSPSGGGGLQGGGVFDGPHGPNSRSEYATEITSGGPGKGGGSTIMRSWPGLGIRGAQNRSQHSDADTAVDGEHEDMEMGRWGGHRGKDKSESEENIIVPAVAAAAEVHPQHGYAPRILKTVDVDVRRGGE
ncbi:MAG: hypothetical protein LQ346_009102 [Caloplaca aetnensis]|nr:MAG: hypothetical protein LQ346_009102 [Caloplaca aetnensis]